MRTRIGIVVLALSLGIVATALATRPHVGTVAKTRTNVVGPSATTARCKHHGHALGGGFATAPGGAVQQSYAAGGGWKAEVFSIDTEAKLTAFARCEPRSTPKPTVVTGDIEIPTDQHLSAVAACPLGRHVISGGFAVRPPFIGSGAVGKILVDESRRSSPRDWTASGSNLGEGTTRLVAYALCRRVSAGDVTQVKVTSTRSTGEIPLKQTTRADCPSGRHVVGGGFSLPNLTTGTLISAPFRSRPSGAGGWVVSDQVTTPAPRRGRASRMFNIEFSTYAYCDRN